MDVLFKLASGGLIAISVVGTGVVLWGGYRYTVVRPKEMQEMRAVAAAAAAAAAGAAPRDGSDAPSSALASPLR